MSATPSEKPRKDLWRSAEPIQEEHKDSNGIVRSTPEVGLLLPAADVHDRSRQSPPLTEPAANQPMTVNKNPKAIEPFRTPFHDESVKVETSEEEEQPSSLDLCEAKAKISMFKEKVGKLEEDSAKKTIIIEQLQADKEQLTKDLEKTKQQLRQEEQHRENLVEQKAKEISDDREKLKQEIADLQQRVYNLNIRKSPSCAQEPDRNPDNEFDGPLTPMGATVAVIPNHVDKSQTPEPLRPVTGYVHVALIGDSLGRGAFGTVKEVVLTDGRHCAGKIFRRDVNATQSKKFAIELSILTNPDHNHIVKYYGLCELPDSDDSDLPMLVMERLSTSLRSYYFDRQYSNLCPDFHTKFTILLGVAKGLAYLHLVGVIHRDLHDNNILLQLDPFPVAKIADFGNSCITRKDMHSQLESMTPIPAFLHYMPPEAESGRYTDRLDVFSYGHLALLVVIKNPLKNLKPVKIDAGGPGGHYMARTEVDRRQSYIDEMIAYLSDKGDHSLVELVKQCLHDKPDLRPSAESVISRLEMIPVEPINSVHNYEPIASEEVDSSDSNSFPDLT